MRAAYIALCVVLVGALTLPLAVSVSAQETPTPVYNNSTNASAEQDSWSSQKDGNSLNDVSSMLARMPSYLITGSAGLEYALVSGLLVTLMVTGMMGITRPGIAVGVVAGVSVAGVFSGLGLLPTWVYAGALIIVAVVAYFAFARFKR